MAGIISDKLNFLMREKYGLVYQVGVDWHRYSIGNQLDIDIDCSAENMKKVLELLEVELARLEIDPGSVEQKKSEFVQVLQFLPEDPSALADYMLIQKTLFPDYSVETPSCELDRAKDLVAEEVAQVYDKVIRNSRSGLFMIGV